MTEGDIDRCGNRRAARCPGVGRSPAPVLARARDGSCRLAPPPAARSLRAMAGAGGVRAAQRAAATEPRG